MKTYEYVVTIFVMALMLVAVLSQDATIREQQELIQTFKQDKNCMHDGRAFDGVQN